MASMENVITRGFSQQPTELDKLAPLRGLRERQKIRVGKISQKVRDTVYRALGSKAIIPAPMAQRRETPKRPVIVPLPGEKGISQIAQIFQTSAFSDLKEFGRYIERGGINVRLRGQTPLTLAAYSGSLDGVRLLLSNQDIGINEANDFGSTALMLAAQEGHLSVIKALLSDERFDIGAHDQGRKALKKARHPLIHDLIQRKLEAQSNALNIFKKLIQLITH